MNLDRLLDGLPDLRALVVGDICLDRWCHYDPLLGEDSLETGIPRLAVVRTENTPGAGGTIANNLAALGVGYIGVLGCIGEDGFGLELLRALTSRGIAPDLMVRSGGMATFTYTKLINSATGEEDRSRVDHVNTAPLSEANERQVLDALRMHASDFDVILVSDQAETDQGGVVTPKVRDHINDLAESSPDKVVWVDSRRRPEHFRHVVLKPNRGEADAACERTFGERDYGRLFRNGQLRTLIVTHGEAGVEVISDAGSEWVPTRKVRAVDVCGAGDSFSAGAACALAMTGSPVEASRFGNLVASITVTKRGTGTATPNELREAEAEGGV